MQFDATAAEVEDLLIAEFYVFEHVSGAYDISSQEYHLPSYIQEHVDYVTPGTRLRQRKAKRENERAGLVGVKPLITQLPGFPYPNASSCNVYVTAECTRGELFQPLLDCLELMVKFSSI